MAQRGFSGLGFDYSIGRGRNASPIVKRPEPTIEELRAKARKIAESPAYLRRQLERLDEAVLGRRRLASEERHWRRLRREIAVAEARDLSAAGAARRPIK